MKVSFKWVALHGCCDAPDYLHFVVAGGIVWWKDPESYADGSLATGRASLAGQVDGDGPD
jgi:hypothetical protein